MLTLADLVTKLLAGPVADSPLAGLTPWTGGALPAAMWPLGAKIDAVLLRLFTRYPVLVKELELVTFGGRFVYPLEAKYALTSGSAEPQKFLLDSVAEPFLGDVLAIERMFDGDHSPLALNDRNDSTSWFTGPTPTTLSMDYPVDATHYYVEYRARHPKLDLSAADPASVWIQIPDVMENALLAGTVYEVFCNQSGENAAAKAAELQGKFENECLLLDDRNSLNQYSTDTNLKLELGGWV